MFTVYTRSPQKKITTITEYLYGTKKYRWLNDVCQWRQQKQDTQWSKQQLQQGIVQQSMSQACITSYLSRVKLDQIKYLQGNQIIAKAQYDKDIQGTYQTQEQRKDCQCGSLYRVYVKRTAQWNSNRCKWKQPSYQIYYTLDKKVSDQALYERNQLGCITKIEQSLYMGRTVSSYRLQEFGGLQNLTVFPQETMQQIQFMSWVPMQQQENCLCSAISYNFYRYRKASVQNAVWVTDSITYQCSTEQLPVFIKGYKPQDQPCYTRSQERQLIQTVKKKLSQQDIQKIKQQLEQQDIQNPPKWSVLKQPQACIPMYRIDRHYLFDCQKVEWVQTYTDDYGLVNTTYEISLSDSNYVRTYYQDSAYAFDYQTSYLQYVGSQAVLHVRIAKYVKQYLKPYQTTKSDATTKKYLNPKNFNCSNLDYVPGTNIIQDAVLLLSIISQQSIKDAKQCISLFSYNSSYYLQYYNNKTDKYLFTILIGKIKGVPICMNYRWLSADYNVHYVALSSVNHVKLLTSQAVYYIDLATGLVQKYFQLGQIFTSVKCTTSSCYFIATTVNNSTPGLYYWGILPSSLTVKPVSPVYNQPDQTIYRMGNASNIDSLYLFNSVLVGFNTEGELGDYILCVPPWLFSGAPGVYLYYNSLYKKVHKPKVQPVINYTNIELLPTTLSFELPYYATDTQGNITTLKFIPSYANSPASISEQVTQLSLQSFRVLYPVAHKATNIQWVSIVSPQVNNTSSIVVQRLHKEGNNIVSSHVHFINDRILDLMATNIDELFCKQQAFDDTILLRPTSTLYNPAKIITTNDRAFAMLVRDSIDMTQNYRYVLDFSYAWNTTYSFWQMQRMTLQVTSQPVTQFLGYNQEQTQYSGKLLVTPDTQVSHAYYNVLLPGKPYAQSFSPPQPIYTQWRHTVYKPLSAVQNKTYTADADLCYAAYGDWFTGRTTTQGDTCYCLVYTDQTKAQVQKLQGQCRDTQISYFFGYLSDSAVDIVPPGPISYVSPWTKVDSYASMLEDSNIVPIIMMYGGSCFVQQAAMTQSSVTYSDIFSVASALDDVPANSIVLSFIQYKQQTQYTVFTAYVSADHTQLKLFTATVYSISTLTVPGSFGLPWSRGFTSIYDGTNPQNTPWYALARVYAVSYLALLSPTHIGYLNNNGISTIRLNTQYSDKITSIYTKWSFLTQATAIFVALTKNKQGIAFIFFNPLTATYKTVTVNVSIPTNQDVSIVGVSCYDTKQIGVVIGPYTVCTVDSNYGPRQRVTLVKLKNTGATVDTVYVSYNKEIKVAVLSDVPDTELHAFSSGSSVTFSDPQKDLIKSYDKDLVVFNLNSQWPKYMLNIKTCTITKASVV